MNSSPIQSVVRVESPKNKTVGELMAMLPKKKIAARKNYAEEEAKNQGFFFFDESSGNSDEEHDSFLEEKCSSVEEQHESSEAPLSPYKKFSSWESHSTASTAASGDSKQRLEVDHLGSFTSAAISKPSSPRHVVPQSPQGIDCIQHSKSPVQSGGEHHSVPTRQEPVGLPLPQQAAAPQGRSSDLAVSTVASQATKAGKRSGLGKASSLFIQLFTKTLAFGYDSSALNRWCLAGLLGGSAFMLSSAMSSPQALLSTAIASAYPSQPGVSTGRGIAIPLFLALINVVGSLVYKKLAGRKPSDQDDSEEAPLEENEEAVY